MVGIPPEIIAKLERLQQTQQPPRISNLASLAVYAQRIQEDDQRFMEYASKNGYNPNLVIANTQVKNKLYQGDSYSVKYDGYNITIKNKTKNYTTTLNLANLLRGMSDKEKLEFLKTIQNLPAEVLEDMAAEIEHFNSTNGVDMHTNSSNSDFVAGGFYNPNTDRITTKPQHIVHELGHAIDYQGQYNLNGENNYSKIANNPKFKNAFEIGLERFKKAGNKQYDYDDKKTWPGRFQGEMKRSNYCTANQYELWAELYTALTTGTCRSYRTIVTYFSEAIEIGKELLANTRRQEAEQRHNSPTRIFINTFS